MNRARLKVSEQALQILQIIGEKIRLARKRRMLTETEFARYLGVSRSTLRQLEKGAPRIAFSAYIEAFMCLGKHLELIQFASTDFYGQKLRDERILAQKYKVQVPASDQPQILFSHQKKRTVSFREEELSSSSAEQPLFGKQLSYASAEQPLFGKQPSYASAEQPSSAERLPPSTAAQPLSAGQSSSAEQASSAEQPLFGEQPSSGKQSPPTGADQLPFVDSNALFFEHRRSAQPMCESGHIEHKDGRTTL
jgi:transcriptional regulator with XRE-family HTH domain